MITTYESKVHIFKIRILPENPAKVFRRVDIGVRISVG
jgi:hypothetical protein